MSTIRYERTYQCWDDCQMQGCPTHVASLEFQSTSTTLTFDNGRPTPSAPGACPNGFIGWPTEFEALVAMLVECAGWRGEVEELLDTALKGSKWDRAKGDAA